MKMLKRRDVAEAVGVAERTIDRWLAHGTFPQPVEIGPRTLRWREVDLEAFVDGRAKERAGSRADAA